jgi:zinc transport system permease protein
MFDDFFIRALIAGIGVAIVTGPIGCFVVWRRLAYYGDTLAHSGLLGVTLGFVLSINISFSVFVVSAIVALLLLFLQTRTKLTGDALLGLLAHSTLAIGLVLIAVLTSIRIDLMGLLFGDILSVSSNDIVLIWVGGVIILLILFFIWKPLFAATIDYDLAKAERMNPDVANFVFTILIAGIIAISIKMIGVLLITGLLLIPPAMARNFSISPKEMVIFSIIGGIMSVVIGLFGSLGLNTPSGPTIIVVSMVLFTLSLFFKRGYNNLRIKQIQ